MTKQELAKRILTLILPWPLSRLMPSSIRSTFTLSPGTGATPYIGSGAPAPTPGPGAISQTIFVPLPLAPQGILSGLVSWPSNTSAVQGPPSATPPSSPPTSDLNDLLVDTYWSDNENNASYDYDAETGYINAEGDFILYPTDIIDEDTQIDQITVDFEGADSIGTVQILSADIDDVEAVTIGNVCVNSNAAFCATADVCYGGQIEFAKDIDMSISSMQFCLKKAAGDITSTQFRVIVFNVTGTGITAELSTVRRQSSQVTGDNTWDITMVPFTFDPPLVYRAGQKLGCMMSGDPISLSNYAFFGYDAAHFWEGHAGQWKSDGTIKQRTITYDAAIKTTYKPLDAEETIATFENVTSGLVLDFTMMELKSMHIVFKDPENPGEGWSVTGLSAQTYGFSTG